MAARMKDIAQALKVSIVTVSKVLNNDPSISEATRLRVLACARQLGYRTNLAAKSLVTGRSKTIGLIVPDLFHGFFSEIAATMAEVLRRNGYGLLIASSRDDDELEREEIQQMLSRSVDALVVATCEVRSDTLNATCREVPLVLLDRKLGNHVKTSYVGTDNLMAGKLATQHLVDIGRRRIAHIGGPDSSPANDRERAYRSVLKKHKLDMPNSYVVKRTKNEESSHITGAQAMRKLLGLKLVPDGVFCYNDPTAIGAMFAILEAGLRIPQDIALLGCGNIQHAGFMQVPLTSIDQNAPLLGEKAANLALAAIERSSQEPSKPQDVIIKPTLVIRRSTSS
jgi:LacI family transcriptional regulator